MTNIVKKNRNNFIDIIKGVAIFLMLWGHCIQYCLAGSEIDFFENTVFKIIYSFHMPLFMLVSGYLFFYSFSKRDLKALLIHKTQSLLQPIIFCSIFNFFATTVLFSILEGSIAPAFNVRWLGTLSSLWFLWSVLAASLATAIICKKCHNISLQILLFFATIPIIAIFPNRDMNIYMYPYFVLGFYFAKYKDKLPNIIYNIKYVCLILFPILILFFEKKHYIYTTGIFPNETYSSAQMLIIDAFRWLIGLIGSIAVITLLELVYKHIIVRFKKPIISTAVSKMGVKSLQIYTLSVPFLSIYLSEFFPVFLSKLNIDNIFAKNMFVYNFIFTLILSICYSFVLWYIIKLLERLKITNVLFGKY